MLLNLADILILNPRGLLVLIAKQPVRRIAHEFQDPYARPRINRWPNRVRFVQQGQQCVPSAVHQLSANLNHVQMGKDPCHRRLGAGDQILVHQRLTHETGGNVVAVTAAVFIHDSRHPR